MPGKSSAPKQPSPSVISRWFTAALIVLAMVVVVRLLAPETIGEQARRFVLQKLKEHYVGMEVSIRRGRFEPEVGIILEDVVIADPQQRYKQLREMVRIERLVIFANVHPEKLLDQQSPFTTTRIAMKGIDANTFLDEHGQPSLLRLLPLPKFGPQSPRVDVLRAKLHVYDRSANQRPISTELSRFTLLNQPQMDGSLSRTITVSGVSDFADGFHARYQAAGGSEDIRVAARGFRIQPGLFDILPSSLRQPLLDARGLRCKCDVTVSAFRVAGGSFDYRLRSTVHEGEFRHPKLPMPIMDLRGVVSADPQGISIEASQAKMGAAIVRVSGKVQGHRWPADAQFKVSTSGLLLDEQFAGLLSTELRTHWEKFQPRGRVDVAADVTCRQGQWDANASIACKGIDVSYEKFPYPVHQLVGNVEVRDGIATSEMLTGRVDSHGVRCMFRVPIRPGITNEKTFVASVDGPVAIDRTLIKALTHRGSPQSKFESFVRSLRPRGSIHLTSAAFGTDVNGRETREVDLRIIDGHLRYDKFAYPLYNVDGQIEIADDLVRLTDFRGISSTSGVVTCEGTYRIPKPSADPILFRIADSGSGVEVPPQLALAFHSTNIPMDDSLRSSIPESAQHTWDAIAPSGVLDEARLLLRQQRSGDPLQIDLAAHQFPTTHVSNRTLSLRPVALPYRIDIVGGTVLYDGSQVTIHSLVGQHSASRLAADGICVRGESGRWELTLDLKGGSRLNADAELIDSLPTTMREAMRRLQLRGPVSLRGKTKLVLSDAQHPEPNLEWNVALQLEGNRIADAGPVHSLRGEIKVAGSRDGRGILADGIVQIDSMHVNDLQITQIHGPFSVVNDRLSFGPRPTQPSSNTNPAESIQGRLFDGIIEMRGDLMLSTGMFDVDLAILDAQVPTLLADLGHSGNELKGFCSGQASFEGSLGTMDFLKGTGSAKVTDANLYQLPLIVQVLNQLRIKPTEDVAFTDGTVQFSMFGDSMTFNELTLWGDWVALHGSGTLDGRRELDLTFNTRVSPHNVFTKVIQPLRGERYTIWTMDVKGPLHAPAIERRAFEGVSETLERLLPSISTEAPRAAANPPTGLGRWLR